MRSKIYTGTILHTRLLPVKHHFEYPVYFYVLDLDELETLSREVKFFGHNRFNIASIYDRDYLSRGTESIRGKLMAFLKPEGLAEKVKRIELVTSARYFGAAFNPVNFYYCYGTADSLETVVAEINNTFGETHLYILKESIPSRNGFLASYRVDKEFHVSPFFDRKGHYEFRFSPTGDKIEIQSNLFHGEEPAMVSNLQGTARPLTTGNLLKTLLRFPLAGALTLARIEWQAGKLYFIKKLPVFKKPVPLNERTIKIARPRWYHPACVKLVTDFLSRVRVGRLLLTFPEGKEVFFGDARSPVTASIQVHHYNFFSRLVRDAGIGMGESYTDHDWDTPDLTAVLNLLIENKPYFSKGSSFLKGLGDLLNHVFHLTRKNTVKGSSKNIRDHYDLSNDFFKIFLDETMTYSSGIYLTESDSPAEAQRNKLRRIIEKARIGPDDHVLEIGFGWGSCAMEAVRMTGCRVTGITLSKEQYDLASERVRQAGLQDRIQFQICDYRKMTGKFDRIISIEMLEAVGHEYLGDYFSACDRLLKPEGIAVIQVITIPDQRYETYRRQCDWIQKHIFPGAHLPSLTALSEAITRNSDFFIEDLENIGIHYARTLREWCQVFMERKEDIKKLGFPERFVRKWQYYFCYCESGFGMRYLNDLQLVLTRCGNKNLSGEVQRKDLTEIYGFEDRRVR